MSAEVVELWVRHARRDGDSDPSAPHITGHGYCIGCKHRWQQVAPVGTTYLECPSCGAETGVWAGQIFPPDHRVFFCNCGNDLFYLTSKGPFCPACGVRPKDRWIDRG